MDGDNFRIQEVPMSTMLRITSLSLARRAAFTGRRTLNGGRGGFAGRAIGLVVAAMDLLYVWQQRLRDRDILRQMSTAQLKDIGISRADALEEADKPFWRA
jgi:uncharacterized protein YjiS (DUF1127 family)